VSRDTVKGAGSRIPDGRCRLTVSKEQPELEVLSALSDPTRWQLLDEIADRGGATATVLAIDRSVSRQAVVKHLGVLERAGLVTGRRAGREMRYTVRTERLEQTARDDLAGRGRPRS